MKPPNFYAANGLDRAGHRRRDPAWLAERLAHPESRFVPVWRSQSLIVGTSGGAPEAVLLRREAFVAVEGEPILLGLREEHAYFALDLSAREVPLEAFRAPQEPTAEFTDLRRVGPLLARPDGALLAYARGIVHWHGRHRFCAVCGSPTRSEEGGHLRRCTDPACNAQHFPRTDPAVIMLVTDGERALLGRQKIWPKGQHSTLAGFVEPGESLEEAVAREVEEETGIRVEDVQYHSSQPWPFPSSIMLGFTARATNTEITLDPEELEAARWFDRSYILAHSEDDEFRLPRRDSIARRLIEDWLKR
ncbi:MAG TPA: NAD(+) diphosphatase [Stellaceae bacterium]|nr:NAD(+) diphosphatase [Stellaceae bacterium]